MHFICLLQVLCLAPRPASQGMQSRHKQTSAKQDGMVAAVCASHLVEAKHFLQHNKQLQEQKDSGQWPRHLKVHVQAAIAHSKYADAPQNHQSEKLRGKEACMAPRSGMRTCCSNRALSYTQSSNSTATGLE